MQTKIFTSFEARDFMSLITDTVNQAVRTEVDRIISRPQETQKPFLTRKEVGKILGVSLVTLNDWSKSGIVPSYRLGTRIRYRFTDIENALQARRGKGRV